MKISKRIGGVLLLIFCASLISACSSPEKDETMHYENALQLIEEGNKEAAIQELRGAIHLNAKHGEARYQLGLIYLEQQEAEKAFAELVRAADLLPDNLDANVKVALFYLLSQNKEECRKRLDLVLAKDPKYFDALALLAQLELTEGNYEQALAALEQTGEELDSSPELQGMKGRVHVAQKKWKEAEAAFLAAISLDKDDFSRYKNLLYFYETRGEVEKAKEFLAEIVLKFPNNAGTLLLQADYFHNAGEVEKVEEKLEQVVPIEPMNPRFRLQLADYYRQKGKNDQAEEVLVKAYADINNKPAITAALATFYFDRNKFDKAKSLLGELQKDNPGDSGTKLLEARFLIKENKFREAADILQGLNKDFPNLADPYYYLGLVHYSLGEIDLALQAMATAIQKDGNKSQYHTDMARFLIAKGEYEDARSEAMKALQLNNNSGRAALLLGTALIGTKQYDQAVTILTELRKGKPGDISILRNLAIASLEAKDRQKGEEYLAELLEIDPGHNMAVVMLIGLRHKDDLPGAEAFVRQQISKAPEDYRLYLILGSILEKQKKDDEALAIYDEVLELSKENTKGMLAAANLLRRRGRSQEAMARFQAMVERNPKSIPGMMGIADLLVAEGSYQKAREQYENVLQIDEGNLLAANNLAYLIASDPQGDLGKALMLAMRVKKALPNEPSAADTLGWVHYKRGSYSLATTQFKSALQNKPDDLTITYHLALAQGRNDQVEDAVQNLEKLLARKEEFDDRKNAEELLSELQNK